MWFTSRVEATSTELCFLYYNLREVHSSAAPHIQLEIFWVTPHLAWSPSLLDLFSIFPSYNILSLSLCVSVNPCGLLQYKITVS